MSEDQPKSRPSSGTIPPLDTDHSSVVGEILGGEPTKKRRPEPVALVIFGATGDLAGRKLAPALFNVMLDKSLTEPTVIIGVSRKKMPVADFAEKLRGRRRFTRARRSSRRSGTSSSACSTTSAASSTTMRCTSSSRRASRPRR